MLTRVDGVTLPPGTTLAWYESIDSTNEEARRRVQTGERGPLWIVAERQTQGRGRQGRGWSTASGNLAATYLFEPGLRPERMALLSFVAALAVQGLVSEYVPDVRLKWPNDVLVRRRKVAGILLESLPSSCLAIGIGVNLAAHPQDLPFPATSIAAEGGRVPALPQALSRLAQRLDDGLKLFAHEGFPAVRDLWTGFADGVGETLRVRLPDQILEGIFLGLGDDGALRLGLADGTERPISAGDVFFPDGA